MRTSLIEGKQVPKFDSDLVSKLPSGMPAVGTVIPIILGVQNEQGEIYRIIETGDPLSNKKLSDALRGSGYFVDPLAPDNPHSLWAIVKSAPLFDENDDDVPSR